MSEEAIDRCSGKSTVRYSKKILKKLRQTIITFKGTWYQKFSRNALIGNFHYAKPVKTHLHQRKDFDCRQNNIIIVTAINSFHIY